MTSKDDHLRRLHKRQAADDKGDLGHDERCKQKIDQTQCHSDLTLLSVDLRFGSQV